MSKLGRHILVECHRSSSEDRMTLEQTWSDQSFGGGRSSWFGGVIVLLGVGLGVVLGVGFGVGLGVR